MYNVFSKVDFVFENYFEIFPSVFNLVFKVNEGLDHIVMVRSLKRTVNTFMHLKHYI